MKKRTEASRLSDRYVAALRAYFEDCSQTRLQVAQKLGLGAVAIGLETLDLARMHEEALIALLVPGCAADRKDDMTRSAAMFFGEANGSIEGTHRAAQEARIQLQRVSETLDQRTKDVADSNRELQSRITDRKTAEAALNASQLTASQLLNESRLIEKELQGVARKILSAHEEERRKMSLHLNDEIAQTLLGIHVRLLALKRAAAGTLGLTKEIATTQHLVDKSVKTIARLAREVGIHYAPEAH